MKAKRVDMLTERTETDIQRDILAALSLAFPAPIAWWHRCNTGKFRGHSQAGLGNGTPDVIGCVASVMVGVEVKRPGHNLRPDQVAWRDKHVAAGGVYVLAHSAQEAIDGVRLELAKRKVS